MTRAGANLTSRRAKPGDAERIATIYNQGIHDRVATFETEPRAVEAVRGWFDQPYPIVVVEAEGIVIAWANTSSYRPRACYAGNVEFSVYVDRDWRGHGAGKRAMQALIEEARAAGLEKLISRVFVENVASRRMLTGIGFREVGTYARHAMLDGVWRDVVIVEYLLQDHAGEPYGALWQPNPDTLIVWPYLAPGDHITVEKLPWEDDRAPLRYPATVLPSRAPEPWVEVRAQWTLAPVDVAGLHFEPGDEVREFFSPRHPFNVFGVHAPDGTFRGWYGNVTRTARLAREEDTLVLTWPDLMLDLVMLPDGSVTLLDDDELDASPLLSRETDLARQIVEARNELRRLLDSGFFPQG